MAAVCVMLLQIPPMHSVSYQLQSPEHWRAAEGAACAAARLGSLGADALVVTICRWTDTVNSQLQRQHPQQVSLYPVFQICSCSKLCDQLVVMPCCACSLCLHGCLTDMVQHCCSYPASMPRSPPPLGCDAGAEREGSSPGAPSSPSPSDGGVDLASLSGFWMPVADRSHAVAACKTGQCCLGASMPMQCLPAGCRCARAICRSIQRKRRRRAHLRLC